MATDDELLTAYVDGVSELAQDERRRVEARLVADPALRADADEIAALLARAREPVAAPEPDWLALERQIREAVGTRVPVPWWRRARWLAPIGTLATTAAIALVWLHHAPIDRAAAPVREAAPIAMHATAPGPSPKVAEPVEAAPARPTSTAIYIDGQVVDLGEVDPEALRFDDDDGDTGEATAGTELLPAADYGWLDQLDDAAVERAERWLERKKG